MVPTESDCNKRLITLTVITLSGFHCITNLLQVTVQNIHIWRHTSFSDELGYLVDAIVNEDKIGSFDKRPNDLSLEVTFHPLTCWILYKCKSRCHLYKKCIAICRLINIFAFAVYFIRFKVVFRSKKSLDWIFRARLKVRYPHNFLLLLVVRFVNRDKKL